MRAPANGSLQFLCKDGQAAAYIPVALLLHKTHAHRQVRYNLRFSCGMMRTMENVANKRLVVSQRLCEHVYRRTGGANVAFG